MIGGCFFDLPSESRNFRVAVPNGGNGFPEIALFGVCIVADTAANGTFSDGEDEVTDTP